MLIKPQPGARLDTNARYSTEQLVNANYDFSEQPESMRFHHHFELLSHCKDKDPVRAQQDDGVTGLDFPVKDTELKPRTGGPVTSVRKH